ncbi:MAG: hypothetical protein V1908_00970 [Candidatus Peregrinibacteria bacterium]
MSFKILADTFSVARDSSHFIQIKTIKKPRSEEQVWMVVEIEGETRYARSTVQNLIETVDEVYFADLELTPYERFEATLKEINLIVKNLKEKRGPKALGNLSAIVAVFSGNELHITQSKQAEAYLVRKGKLSMVSEGLGGKSDDLFANIASGELLPDDKVIFTTSRLLRLATQSQLVQILNDGVTEAVDALRELVMAENELSLGVGCVHIKLPQRSMEEVGQKNAPAWLSALDPWLKKLKDLWNKNVGKKLPLPNLRSKIPGMPKLNMSRKNILATLLGVLLVLVVSVSFLMDSRRNEALRTEYRGRIDQLNQDIQTANTKGYANEKETANAILDKVDREARDILGANFFRDEVMILMDKVQTTRDNINNTLRVKDLKPYVDLGAKKSSVNALGLLNLDDKFFAYEYNTLFEIILDQVLDPKTIDAAEVVLSGTAMEDQGLLIFLTQSGRIIEYDGSQFSFANTEDTAWKSGADVAAYGRNVYLLDPANNQIYKYSRLRSNFSSASEYNTDADLNGAIDLAIDGNVYVLKTGGEVIKLFKSKTEAFELTDMAVETTTVTKIFTSIELNNLYLLDPVNKRVIIALKEQSGNARYSGQVVFDGLEGVKDLYVDKGEAKLYLLTESAVYQIDL